MQDVEIERLAAGGRGVGRVDGRVWLVEGGIPGDRVRAEPLRCRPRLVEARVARILEPSPRRRRPPCPHQSVCGGCPWMVLDEEDQRRWRRELVRDALVRIGGLDSVVVEETIPSPRALGYRGKVEFSFASSPEGRRVLGLLGRSRPPRVVDIDRCLLQGEAEAQVLSHARAFFLEGPGKLDPWPEAGREAARLVVRGSGTDGGILVALRGGDGPFPTAEAYAKAVLESVPQVRGVVRLIPRPGRRGGTRTIPLGGTDRLSCDVLGTRFRVPAATFLQVNPGAADRLAEQVVAMAGDVASKRLLELYGGVGALGVRLARSGAEVTVVEADAAAVECGQEAARDAGLETSVRFVRGDVARWIGGQAAGRYDLVLADPPRAGMPRGVTEAIARLAPARVILVSCDPATLARDLARLGERGYGAGRVLPIDLFPQTAHVETVTSLERRRTI